MKVRTAADAPALNFLLDSGADSSVLSLPAARKLGVKLGKSEAVRRVGTREHAWRVTDFRATVADISVCKEPLALDLSDASKECSRPIDGLLGQDFFRGRVVEIDFKEKHIRLLDEPSSCACCAILRLRVENGAMCVPISVNGSEPEWTRLDTGCDDGLHWVARASDGYVKTSLRLGNERVANVKTMLHSSAIFPDEAGLLGNGVLSNYRVTIDSVNRRLLLQKS